MRICPALIVLPLVLVSTEAAASGGLRLTGVYDRDDGHVRGAQISLFGNMAAGGATGLQLAVFGNSTVVEDERAELRGVQVAWLINIAGTVRGAQIGAVDFAERLRGVQLGLLTVSGEAKGAQLGLYNYALAMHGVQVGAVNVTRHLRGVQVGFLNVALDAPVPYTVLVNASL